MTPEEFQRIKEKFNEMNLKGVNNQADPTYCWGFVAALNWILENFKVEKSNPEWRTFP